MPRRIPWQKVFSLFSPPLSLCPFGQGGWRKTTKNPLSARTWSSSWLSSALPASHTPVARRCSGALSPRPCPRATGHSSTWPPIRRSFRRSGGSLCSFSPVRFCSTSAAFAAFSAWPSAMAGGVGTTIGSVATSAPAAASSDSASSFPWGSWSSCALPRLAPWSLLIFQQN